MELPLDQRLDDVEQRVLGVLIEKSLSQPDYYPMTLNALVAGCNQKSNRDPVLSLEESDVQKALEELRRRALVGVVLPAPGARADRYKHQASSVYGWGPKDSAIMTELMLRGPQTVGELRSRCARMVPIDSLEHLQNVLEDLAHRDPPMIRPLPREPGRSAVRYAHLLGLNPLSVGEPTTQPSLFESSSPQRQEQAAGSGGQAPAADDSMIRIRELEEQVAALQARVDELTQRLAAIESGLGM